jgi:hypothetical protein
MKRIIIGFLLGGAMFASVAQSDLLSTVGLAHRDQAGRDWAYIAWQSPNSSAVAEQFFAVYAKAGTATSSNNYERKAIITRQQDTRVIDPLLARSVNLGEALPFLEADLNKLFDRIIPAGTLGASAKLSAVLRGTAGNERAYRNLTLLARIHPGVALCMGTAHAELFPPGVSNLTFEVRQWDNARQMDLAVVGRVTVTAGASLVLPSPGAPVEVPDLTASGNLNVKLRWPMTDSLRRLSMATHGFNLWRVTKTYAESHNFHITPPTVAQLFAAPPSVRAKLNDAPILAAKYFDAATVADFSTNGDPKTFFFTDDNNYFIPGNTRFQDGEAFYYFVTARDLLGRDGQPSPGLLARACDRIPPQAPRHLRAMSVHNYTGAQAEEGVKLSWYPSRCNGIIDCEGYAYLVYRYNSRQELQTRGHLAESNRIAGPLVFPPGTLPMTYIDRPCTNGLTNTFWYVVRAAESNACGTNISAPSGAAWGACRDWSGPSGATGVVYTVCLKPEVNCVGTSSAQEPIHPGKCHFRLVCIRDSRLIEWAEFFEVGSTNPIGRIYFANKATNVVQEVYVKAGQNYQFYCRVGTSDGAEDVGGPCQPVDCGESLVNTLVFRATVNRSVVLGTPNDTDGCFTHFRQLPYPPTGTSTNNTGTNNAISITLNLPPGTKEYRLYRSVDGGAKGLVSQGTNATNSVTISDNALPANSCTICYYSQPFDEHGNPGPLTRVEPCVPVTGILPAPQQLPIGGAALTLAGSLMKLSWFCPSPGIDHFEVWISDAAGIVSSDLTFVPQLVAVFLNPFAAPAAVAPTPSEYTIFRTPRIGAAFGSNDLFSVLATTSSGHAHKVMIRAVDIHGNTGPFSNEEEYLTSLKAISLLPQVSWPARDLPLPTNRVFTPMIEPLNVRNSCFDGIGIKVGTVELESYNGCTNVQLVTSSLAISSDRLGGTFMPAVLYRQQVANFFYPTVSGDVVQVSPLIENIFFTANGGNYTYLNDPFFTFSLPGQGNVLDIVLKDTQPVVVGARYRYSFVRFKDNHEIAEVLPLGEVEVTP